MSRRRPWRAAGSLALLALLSGPVVSGARADPRAKDPPPEPGVTVERAGGVRRLNAVLPGRLLGYALPAAGEGRRRVVLLVSAGTPEPPGAPGEDGEDGEAGIVARSGGGGGFPGDGEDPRRERAGDSDPEPPDSRLLLELDLSGTGGLTPLAEDLHPETASVEAMDLDGDGVEEILLNRPGEISAVRRGAPGEDVRLEPLIADSRLVPGPLDPALIRAPGIAGTAHFAVPVLGGLLLYGPAGDGTGWEQASRVDLAVDAELDGGMLKLSSPLVREAGRPDRGRPLLAAGPRRAAGWRLRCVLLDPLGPEAARRTETWARLPGPETLMESWFALLDGEPVLVVTTRSAEKLSFFAEKRVRVFPMVRADRSRTGSEPLLAFTSGANLWQTILPVFRDLDGDGAEDLVLAYWKGLKDDTVVLEAYVRRRGSSEPRGPARTRFDVENGQRDLLSYGHDLDGDGLAELLVQGSHGLQVHRGLPPGRKGGDLVERSPARIIPMRGMGWQAPGERPRSSGKGEIFLDMMGAIGPPRLADLDGDGRPEILSLRRSYRGRGMIHVIRLDG